MASTAAAWQPHTEDATLDFQAHDNRNGKTPLSCRCRR